MILLDFSNIIVGSIMVAHKVPDEERFGEDYIRHLVLNSIRSYRNKYKDKYGEIIICTDFHSSWRKEVFPYYKEVSLQEVLSPDQRHLCRTRCPAALYMPKPY